MPIYVYKCEKCDYVWDELAKSTKAKSPNCPKCDSKDVAKKPVRLNKAAACGKCCGACGSCEK